MMNSMKCTTGLRPVTRQRQVGRLAYLVALVALCCGCKMQSPAPLDLLSKLKLPTKKAEKDRPGIGPTKVVTDATALALEMPESDLQAREEFRKRFNKLVGEDRLAAADILLSRHPEFAYEVLTNQFDRRDKNLVILAASYDRFCGGRSGWHALAAGNANREMVDQYFHNRSQLFGAITNGHFDETESIDLLSVATEIGQPALLVDAWYQSGVAALLRLENENAAIAFGKAAQIAGNEQGTQGALAMLMVSESLKRTGDYAGSLSAWKESVELACRNIRTKNVTDISFWQRATYLQPISAPWPDCVASALEGVGKGDASAIRTELLQQLASEPPATLAASCWVESALGSWQEARGQHQKALVHLKKAETLTDSESAKDWLRIAQAPILVQVGQKGVATTLLAPLIAREDNSQQMLAAMSKLGVMKLTGGSPQHGVRLLHGAVVDGSGIEWPGKAAAQADLALGLLMIGETAEGMNQMKEAQRRFESEGEIEQLAKSLSNQQQYLKHSDADRKTIAAVTDRLKSMQL